jgi:chitinase
MKIVTQEPAEYCVLSYMCIAKSKSTFLLFICLFTYFCQPLFSQKKSFAVFGYYAGRPTMVDSFPVEKLTHLCFSFTHLKGSMISISSPRDSLALLACVALKKRNTHLKVIVSMGGWTGCFTCSEVFSTDSSRKIFSESVKIFLNEYKADGIDLDWEYPAIKGPPGHPFSLKDKDNFTALIKSLRDALGKEKEISFAAGGFTSYINESIDWKKVTPLVDRINIMTYDLITGYDTVTGHHTGLYSTKKQIESCDHAVKMLVAKGVPPSKLLIGAAFYARIWENVLPANYGLYGNGKFLRGISYSAFGQQFSKDSGFTYHWDKTADAPYLYNATKKWFVTFDDSASVTLKTKYAIKKHLNGIMFWQLADDSFSKGLLDIVDETRHRLRHS